MKRFFAALFVSAILLAGCDTNTIDAIDGTAGHAIQTVTFTGQGFNFDGSVYNLNNERCGLTGQNDADDGGTGQFANWNGEGQPYEAGQGYLLWIVSLNATPVGGVTLHLPDGPVAMIQGGGNWKYASQYYPYAELIGPPAVYATFDDTGLRIRGNLNLVVSHGCQPFDDNGAWCSPGYWKNARDAAWTLIGIAKTDLFNDVVVPNFYDTAFISEAFPVGPTVYTVLDTPGANTFGAASDPFGLNAFNATGAALTDAIPGYSFSLEQYEAGSETACPIDNHGNFKIPQE
jgi:hypothetical protein